VSSALHGEGATGPADARPLSDQEYQLLQRLLSDPLSLPIQFKTWLVAYLEGSDLTLPMSAILGLRSTLGIAGAGKGTLGIFPAGLILPFAATSAPEGSLLCDGAAYATAAQARLFAAIGYSYGGGGGTFNVPDIRGRIPAGKGTHGAVDTLGKNEGVGLGDRSPIHRTSDGGGAASEGITAGADAQVYGSAAGAEVGVHHHGPATAPVDTPAFIVLNFIIVA
jgi:hypothetical protein